MSTTVNLSLPVDRFAHLRTPEGLQTSAGAHCAVAGWLGPASHWRSTPPDQPGFYWLKRRDESLTVVKISRSLLCFSTHGHAGSKRGSLQGLWAGPLTPPSDGPTKKLT